MESFFLSKTRRKSPGVTFNFFNEFVLFVIVILLINDWSYFSTTYISSNLVSYKEMTTGQLFVSNVLWHQF